MRVYRRAQNGEVGSVTSAMLPTSSGRGRPGRSGCQADPSAGPTLAFTAMAQLGRVFLVRRRLSREVAWYRSALEIRMATEDAWLGPWSKRRLWRPLEPFLLQVSTMTGKRASFQGFRGTPMDECPWRDFRCPWRRPDPIYLRPNGMHEGSRSEISVVRAGGSPERTIL